MQLHSVFIFYLKFLKYIKRTEGKLPQDKSVLGILVFHQ